MPLPPLSEQTLVDRGAAGTRWGSKLQKAQGEARTISDYKMESPLALAGIDVGDGCAAPRSDSPLRPAHALSRAAAAGARSPAPVPTPVACP